MSKKQSREFLTDSDMSRLVFFAMLIRLKLDTNLDELLLNLKTQLAKELAVEIDTQSPSMKNLGTYKMILKEAGYLSNWDVEVRRIINEN